MKPKTAGPKLLLTIAWIVMPVFAVSQEQTLTLKHGIFVREKEPCKGAPNAAILEWDGIGFSGAHSTKCMSHVVRKDVAHFEVSTSCAALGDGTPNPAGASEVSSFLLNRLSSTRFTMTKAKDEATYRWCSANRVD